MPSFGCQGPPQVWQMYLWEQASFISAKRRLHRAGHRGLLVGKGCQLSGGLPTHIAERYERQGVAYLLRNEKGLIVKAYACQLSFNFDK